MILLNLKWFANDLIVWITQLISHKPVETQYYVEQNIAWTTFTVKNNIVLRKLVYRGTEHRISTCTFLLRDQNQFELSQWAKPLRHAITRISFNSTLPPQILKIAQIWVFITVESFTLPLPNAWLGSRQPKVIPLHPHRPSLLPLLNEFGLAVGERAINNICIYITANWLCFPLNNSYSPPKPMLTLWLKSAEI